MNFTNNEYGFHTIMTVYTNTDMIIKYANNSEDHSLKDSLMKPKHKQIEEIKNVLAPHKRWLYFINRWKALYWVRTPLKMVQQVKMRAANAVTKKGNDVRVTSDFWNRKVYERFNTFILKVVLLCSSIYKNLTIMRQSNEFFWRFVISKTSCEKSVQPIFIYTNTCVC